MKRFTQTMLATALVMLTSVTAGEMMKRAAKRAMKEK